MKLLGENIRKISLTLDQAEFLDMTQKAGSIKEQVDKFDFIKI